MIIALICLKMAFLLSWRHPMEAAKIGGEEGEEEEGMEEEGKWGGNQSFQFWFRVNWEAEVEAIT